MKDVLSKELNDLELAEVAAGAEKLAIALPILIPIFFPPATVEAARAKRAAMRGR